jgi:hypothetical protein
MNAHYINDLRDVINNDNEYAKWKGWVVRECLQKNIKNLILYHTRELVNNIRFNAVCLELKQMGIGLGFAYSSINEINTIMTWDKTRRFFSFAITEHEFWQQTEKENMANYVSILRHAQQYRNGGRLKILTYIGWTKSTPNRFVDMMYLCDEICMHVYRNSEQMKDPKVLMSFLEGENENRITNLSLLAADRKIRPAVSIIFSSEPVFGQEYFKTNDWLTPYSALSKEVAANPLLAANINLNGCMIFASSHSRVSKP